MPLTPEEALARSVLEGYLKVRAEEVVVVESWSHALPWARAFAPEARRLGAYPILAVEDEETFFRSVAASRRVPLPRAADALAAVGEAYVYLGGPEEFPRLLGLPDGERRHVVERHGPGWTLRAARRRVRAARLAVADATPTAAARYGVDLASWRRELLRASLVPPETLRAGLARWLRRGARGRRVRVRHSNGTDLTVAIEPRRWRAEVAEPSGSSPWIDIPTGLLVLPIRPGRADGVWEANRASFDRYRESPVLDGARFMFRDGRLRTFEFDRGGEAFARARAAGGPERDRPTALTIGLNPAIDRAPERSELGGRAVGLLLGGAVRSGRRRSAGFSHLATLAGADLELDGTPWAAADVASDRPRRATRGSGR